MTDDMEPLRNDAWTQYWATGAAHSCASSFSLEGEGDVACFWREILGETPAGARIVDLGSGNGGLLRVALTLSPAVASWQLVGVDLANHRPAWLDHVPEGKAIVFHGGVAMEALPLPDAGADLLLSQFGIEYARRDTVQAECLRVLAPAGRVAFLVHHADSAVSAVARDELRAHDALLGNDGLLAATMALLPHLAQARAGRQPGSSGNQARLGFNAAMARALALGEELAAPDLLMDVVGGLQNMLSTLDLGNLERQQAALSAHVDDLVLARLRSAEQLACAMDEAELERFVSPFRTAGFAVATHALHESGHLLGWALRGHSVR